MKTKNKSKITVDVILDDGGGSTLQVYDNDECIYVHLYDFAHQLADDLKELAVGAHPIADGWDNNLLDEDEEDEDGNRIDYVMSYNYADVANGCYRWYSGTPSEVIAELRAIDIDNAWGNNGRKLVAALKKI